MNGYGSDTTNITKPFMINTVYKCCEENSTSTKELFLNEFTRKTEKMTDWHSDWKLAPMQNYNNGLNALMIIPNKGLCYPFGKLIPGQ